MPPKHGMKTLGSAVLSFVSELFAGTFLSDITAPVLGVGRFVCN